MKTISRKCPECDGQVLYTTEKQTFGDSAGLWPRLGGFFGGPEVKIVVCGDCGLTRFFLKDASLKQLPEVNKWQRV